MDSDSNKILDQTLVLISDIRHENITEAQDKAVRTIALAEHLINDESWSDSAENLMSLIKTQIKEIVKILPDETVCVNILRHLLKTVRDEHDAQFQNKGEEQSLHNMVMVNMRDDSGDYSKPLKGLRTSLLDHLAEYKVEVESSIDNIAAQAVDYIHSNEIILTVGKSQTVEKFLKAAAKTCTFQVFVVEGSPSFDGREMAALLGESKIKTTVVSDASIYGVMSRVNKVVLDTHTVLADGSLCARCSSYIAARCAKQYSLPVLVLTPLYKLSSKFTLQHTFEVFNMTVNPEEVFPLSMGPMLSQLKIFNPKYERVPSDFITLFVTHQGGNASSYLYRLLTELYHLDDYDL